ncbi:glycosyltransferase family 2 protein [Aquitalea denitrificans]|uniref:glycosyltransferase family 2 protein n=1 Tax=Aquitalea denitrificans TaxID=519081 RepID=UPI00135A818C|nr:glycosyltransferase [Aquitalea denitrificans]
MTDKIQPLLSICIPTYNRINSLKSHLPLLLEIIKPSQEINLIVCDNCSSDGTREYLIELQRDYDFTYHVNIENLGFDRNYLKCIELATGEFTWVLGDDDIIDDRSIAQITHILHNENVDYLIINGGQLQKSSKTILPRLKLDSNIELTDINVLFKNFAWHATWISACIFRTNPAKQYKSKKFITSGFTQVDLLLSIFGNSTRYMLLKQPIVYQSENVSEYSRSISAVLSLFSDSLYSISNNYLGEKLSQNTINSFMLGHYDNYGSFNFKAALYYKIQGQISFLYVIKNYSRLARITRHPSVWIYASLTPNYLIKIARKIWKTLENRKSAL